MRHHVYGIGLVLAIIVSTGIGCGTTKPGKSGTRARVSEQAWWAPEDKSAVKMAAAQAHFGAGVIHEMNGEVDRALEEYLKAAAEDPGNEWLVLEVSRRLVQHKQLEKAFQVLDRAASRTDVSGPVLARFGQVSAQLGKHDVAIAVSRAAIRKNPRQLAGYQTIYVTCLQQKKNQQALAILEDAAAQTRADAEFLVGLSELYASYGVQVPAERKAANEKALAILKRAEKLPIDTPALRLKVADGFSLLGDSDRAARMYLELLKTLPDVPLVREHVNAKLANIYLRGSDRKKAVEQLEAILKDDPTNPQAHYFLGNIAEDEDRTSEAAEHFDKAILLNPDFEQAYYELANVQLRLDQTNQAIATLEKARERFEENFVMEMLAGVAFSRVKDYDRAIRHFTSAEVIAKATDPKRLNHGFYFQMGAAYERRGDYEQAETYFQHSLKLSPDFAEALNYLGYMWAERGVKLDQARELIEKAVKAEPDNAAFLDSLGWVLFKQNQPEAALKHILKAVELSKDPDPTLYDHLGDIYAALNDLEKAKVFWNKSLTLEPNEKVKQKLDGPVNPSQ